MQVAVGMSNEGVSNEGVCGRFEQIRERSGDVDRSLEGQKVSREPGGLDSRDYQQRLELMHVAADDGRLVGEGHPGIVHRVHIQATRELRGGVVEVGFGDEVEGW